MLGLFRCQKLIKVVKFCFIVVLTSWLICYCPPLFAQEAIETNNQKATIMLDGRRLFTVGSIDNFTAEQRADLINRNLKIEVNKPVKIRLKVFVENEQTVIRQVNGNQHILNVTQSDVISGTTIEQQAQVWRNTLQKSLTQGKKERTSEYVIKQLVRVFIGFLLAISFNVLLFFCGKFCLKKLAWLLENPNSPVYKLENPFKIIWNLTIFSLQVGVWIGLLYHVSEVFPLVRSLRTQIYWTLENNIFSLGNSQYSAIELLFLLICTVGIWFVIRLFTLIFKQTILSKTGANRGLQDVIAIVIQYILSFLAIIILWQIWGFDVSSLAILVSIFGVGIGFGLQNIANNFISGLVITIERPIQIGDFIEVGNLKGKVQNIGTRSTIINTIDKVSIIIPNSRLLENEVVNWNHGESVSRIRIPIGVAYTSNIKKVRIALLEAVKSHPDILVTPRPQIWFKEFGESSLNFEVCVWISEPSKQLPLVSELNYRIASSLSRHQIEIPFPQRDLHLRSTKMEKAIEIWLQQQGIEIDIEQKIQQSSIDLLKDDYDNTSFLGYLENQLNDRQIQELVDRIRSDRGIEIRNRRYRLNTYPDCFIGQELVDWLSDNCDYSREQATELGQILIEKKIIHHVTDEHHFLDDYFFYRFYVDEKN